MIFIYMIKLTSILKEGVDQHKRKVYLKAAIEMAKSYSSRGYTPDEAIKDAAQGIKNVYGYELTDRDKEAVKHFVPVNAQFKQ
jgi:plasmid replication initiation protein